MHAYHTAWAVGLAKCQHYECPPYESPNEHMHTVRPAFDNCEKVLQLLS